jgi:uncharacterized membrane protein YraQ (UPF0718 family)
MHYLRVQVRVPFLLAAPILGGTVLNINSLDSWQMWLARLAGVIHTTVVYGCLTELTYQSHIPWAQKKKIAASLYTGMWYDKVQEPLQVPTIPAER